MDEFEETIFASAAAFLVEGQELYEASVLLLSEGLSLNLGNSHYINGESVNDISARLYANRTVYEIISDQRNPTTISIIQAFQAALGSGYDLTSLSCRVVTSTDGNWREKLLDVIEGKIPLNQGVPIQNKQRFAWNYLFFRAPVEISIAKCLESRGVLFLPNCACRLGFIGSRENREADFMVCDEGKWGILEINGKSYHTNAAKDHDRGRLFKLHGIRVFEPYDAGRCIREPEAVVSEFLGILKKNG